MRLRITKSKNVKIYYVIKTIYINKKEKTITIERLGTEEEVLKKSKGEDPVLWAKKYIAELNRIEKEETQDILICKSPVKQIEKNNQNVFNCGYLFLEKIYYDLKIDEICKSISKRHKFEFDLDNILSRLIYGRIINPSSKLATTEDSKKFIEQPNFELQHVYRALEIICRENDFIQSELYKNSSKIIERKKGILYYDCTNFFFEIEQEDELRKYGPSKEHRPNPIVQMGLFMDADGLPLAFNINSGSTNEQQTLTPLEQTIFKDFGLSKVVVCTDAGLSSNDNRKFNNIENRAFITTQSIKKLKKFLMDWALSPNDWRLIGSSEMYNINDIESDEKKLKDFKDKTFYKERWINENGLEQRLIVTYSLKYKNYQRKIRNAQIDRAQKALNDANFKLDKCKQTDYKRFIKKTNITKDGEVADSKILTLDNSVIEKEEKFDGFYGVCTNLEDDVEDIIKVNHRRWEIEESFRIMKSEFKARPVYLTREDRIRAHFMTCYIALLIHRILEKKIEEKYTCEEIIDTLREMILVEEKNGNGYTPAYTRTDLTDELHDKFGFRTDFEITSKNKMKKILKNIRN